MMTTYIHTAGVIPAFYLLKSILNNAKSQQLQIFD